MDNRNRFVTIFNHFPLFFILIRTFFVLIGTFFFKNRLMAVYWLYDKEKITPVLFYLEQIMEES